MLRIRFSIVFQLLIITLCSWSCVSDDNLVESIVPSSGIPIIENVHNDSLGRINAVKKARQLTDIEYSPLHPILGLGKTYAVGSSYHGMVYSMVSEMDNYVGNNVSFHTFMTAVHNPKSKIYTENVSLPPYHGKKCKAYYGVVCSTLVSYALGIYPHFSSRDFHESELMERISPTEIDSVEIADVLWKSGHVAIITDVKRDEIGKVIQVEISESVSTGCRRFIKSRGEFEKLMKSSFKEIYRYSLLYKNIEYTPIPEFVAVQDEAAVPFQYNDDLCVDKGDKSCYLEDEEIVVNVMHSYDYMEIYRNDELYDVSYGNIEDVHIKNLPYGDYKARIFFDNHFSDFTYWKTVNVNVLADRERGLLFFNSLNAKPKFVKSRDESGLMKSVPTNKYCFYIFEEKDIERGYIDISKLNIKPDYPYVRVSFSTEYGTIINKPINWYE